MSPEYRRRVIDWWSSPQAPLPGTFWQDSGAMPAAEPQFRIPRAVIGFHWTDGVGDIDAIGRRPPSPNFDLNTSRARRMRVDQLLSAHAEVIGELAVFADACFRDVVRRLCQGTPDGRPSADRAVTSEYSVSATAAHYARFGPGFTSDQQTIESTSKQIEEKIRRRSQGKRITPGRFIRRFTPLYQRVWADIGDQNLRLHRPSALLLGDDIRPSLGKSLPAAGATRESNDWRLGTNRPVRLRYDGYWDGRRAGGIQRDVDQFLGRETIGMSREIYEFLDTAESDDIAEEAIARSAEPWGLVFDVHHEVLNAVYLALSEAHGERLNQAPMLEYLAGQSDRPASNCGSAVRVIISNWRESQTWKFPDPVLRVDVIEAVLKGLWFYLLAWETFAIRAVCRGALDAKLRELLLKVRLAEPPPPELFCSDGRHRPPALQEEAEEEAHFDRVRNTAALLIRYFDAPTRRLLLAVPDDLGDLARQHRSIELSRYDSICDELADGAGASDKWENVIISSIEWDGYLAALRSGVDRFSGTELGSGGTS